MHSFIYLKIYNILIWFLAQFLVPIYKAQNELRFILAYDSSIHYQETEILKL